MTLQELLAVIAGIVWALLWQPVGRLFGWWAGAGTFVVGGLAGLVIGWLLAEWISRLRPHRNWVRTVASLTSVMLAWLAYAAIPLWVLRLLRAG
jgi:dipeptide/tripeptide permease